MDLHLEINGNIFQIFGSPLSPPLFSGTQLSYNYTTTNLPIPTTYLPLPFTVSPTYPMPPPAWRYG